MAAKRPPTSEAQKEKLRRAQLAYIARDPRWQQHRQNLADAQRNPNQKAVLSAAQLRYMATDPRWPAHQQRMAEAAIEATRLTMSEEEIRIAAALRAKGRTFEYLGEELCISEKIIRREFKQLGYPTARVPSDRRAKRGKGAWRCLDQA